MKIVKIFTLFLAIAIIFFFFNPKFSNVEVKRNDTIQKIFKENDVKYTIIDKILFRLLEKKYSLVISAKSNKKLNRLELIKTIYFGKSKTFKVAIPEGFTSNQVINRISKIFNVNVDDILKYLKNKEFYYPHSDIFEGYFMPSTYTFYENDSYQYAIDTILNNFLNHFPKEKYQDTKSFYDNLILASIVEAETQDKNEVEKVAGVFKHRLNINMRLESDATLRYELENNRQALKKELQTNMSLYNTYKHNGLTPTPINNPSYNTIVQVMRSKEDENLFFFARNNKIYYSKTHIEHLRKRNEIK